MPRIVEIREIDGAIWARIDVDKDYGRVMLLSDKEIEEQEAKMERLLNKIDELSNELGL